MSSSSSRRHITRSTNPIHGRSHREPSSASHSNNTPDEQISDDSVIESDDESMGTVEGYNSSIRTRRTNKNNIIYHQSDEEEDMLEEEEEEEEVEVEEDEELEEGLITREEVDFDNEGEEESSEEVEEEEEDEGQSDYEEVVTKKSSRGVKNLHQLKQTSLQTTLVVVALQEKEGGKDAINIRRVLTKRQRAKLDDNYEEDLLELPMEEEIALKKSEIARKRKHQSIQRAEQDKMDTINRLLKKQATRKRKADQDENDSASNTTASATLTLPSNSIHYVKSVDGSTLSIPIGVEIPIKFEKGPKYPPPIPSCSLSGCDKPKKYRNVKKFEEFACSMEHLKLLSS
ncbi:20654_t:CDS:2 [Entrophospora sp. SA101]|nr:17879_t:CDS:2 [Entrophospora sp. SA101]CAJ0749687.1 20654_t:CDS:2 [Entrophospora sp. SA101]CAJ0913720.1 20907_t:CDS:2 [Entrophospora sp. SA101]